MSHRTHVPQALAIHAAKTPERARWLERLPETLAELESRWAVTLEAPIDTEEVSASWVAPARRADGTPTMLKLAMPHFEGEQEIAGLRFWNGDPTVRLIEYDESLGAMLLERCEPATVLRMLPEDEQDVILAGLLPRMWKTPAPPHAFRTLAALMKHWTQETMTYESLWPDAGLVREGLRLFEALSRPEQTDVLLATDLHAGNVLRAERKPWLVIDPKPFVGDPAYDATQHLFNGLDRLTADPHGTIARFADQLGVAAERVRQWTFARAAAEPRQGWSDCRRFALARTLVG